MRALFLAAESTGMWKFKDEPHADTQPHLVRAAYIADDGQGNRAEAMCWLVWPEPHWQFEPGAVTSHAIDRKVAADDGFPLKTVLADVGAEIRRADTLVLYSAPFWLKMLERAFVEAGEPWQEPPVFDAMAEARDIVKAPRMSPGGGYNLPRFEAAYTHFIGQPLTLNVDAIEAGRRKVRALAAIYDGIRRVRGW